MCAAAYTHSICRVDACPLVMHAVPSTISHHIHTHRLIQYYHIYGALSKWKSALTPHTICNCNTNKLAILPANATNSSRKKSMLAERKWCRRVRGSDERVTATAAVVEAVAVVVVVKGGKGFSWGFCGFLSLKICFRRPMITINDDGICVCVSLFGYKLVGICVKLAGGPIRSCERLSRDCDLNCFWLKTAKWN